MLTYRTKYRPHNLLYRSIQALYGSALSRTKTRSTDSNIVTVLIAHITPDNKPKVRLILIWQIMCGITRRNTCTARVYVLRRVEGSNVHSCIDVTSMVFLPNFVTHHSIATLRTLEFNCCYHLYFRFNSFTLIVWRCKTRCTVHPRLPAAISRDRVDIPEIVWPVFHQVELNFYRAQKAVD